MADIPPYWGLNSKEISIFQTRACAYNHHPAIHQLFPESERIKKQSPDQYFTLRRNNVNQNPSLVQWVHCFIAELDTTIINPIILGSSIFWKRHEWGANGNPHAHKLLVIDFVDDMMEKSKKSMKNEFQKIKQECENYDLSTKSDQEIENFKDKCLERIIAIWEDVKNNI